ncbi:MAG: hypothetical protein E7054_03010 [Lentisphaerae bacterium]|nr:hypothetical protein [Lentisphaerota bacterium]
MLKLLEVTGIPADRAAASIATCPGCPFFLKHDYIKDHWGMAELPADKLQYTLSVADKIQAEPRLRQLAWHLYRYMTLNAMSAVKTGEFPDIIEELGVETGVLYLLVAMSLIPSFISRAEREGFPRKYGEAGAKRIGSITCFFAQNFNGAFGIRGSTMLFLLHYIHTATWRIGRFDFVIQQADDTVPEIYCNGSSVVAFCADGVPLKANHDRAYDEAETVSIARLKIDGSKVTGLPIDFSTGLARKEESSIDLSAGWERVAGPGDWTLFFHIPGGGGMKPDLCRESFKEALEFFKSYVPDKKFRLIWSASWIFNPLWKDLIPQSNMAALIGRGRLFPAFSVNNPGLYFVFGRHDGDPDSFTAVNPVERAVLRSYRENSLRRTGWFILSDEI